MKATLKPQPGMSVFFIFVTVMSCTVHASLQITADDYPLMHYTSLISEENFVPGRPLVLLMPLAAEGSTSNELRYLIQELHKSSRWPVLVFNVSNELNRNMYTEINQHYSYIILIAGSCKEWEQNTFDFQKQLLAFSGGELRESWNPNARFVIQFMANCTHFDCKNISRSILSHLWTYQVGNAIVLFLKLNSHGSNDLQQNTSDSAQGTYLEIHTWYPYENSERCNPADGTVPVKVFTVRNLSDIRKNDIFKGFYDKNFHKCSISVRVTTTPPFVNVPKRVWNDGSGYQDVYEGGWEIEMLKFIGNSLNMSLDIESKYKVEFRTSPPAIYVGSYFVSSSKKISLIESSRNYLTVHLAWYTPCAVKHQKWSRFFNIFSVEMWISFTLSLILAVITVSCISNYRHKSHLHESKCYSNILGATSIIISVVLSVPVNTKPRSTPLRLFFLCWVCYSVAISTVFQAYLTTFLIEPGYVEPIKSVEQMLASDMKFGFHTSYEGSFTDTSDYTDSNILKNAVRFHNYDTCLKWIIDYQNISTILHDFTKTLMHAAGTWTDENNRPLACELEYGSVKTSGVAFLVSQGSPLLEFINDAIGYVVEGGIFIQIRNRGLYKEKLKSNFNIPTFADKYTAISVRHLQTVFYLLLLGYVLAVVCFVTEIMWHRYRSKGREQTRNLSRTDINRHR